MKTTVIYDDESVGQLLSRRRVVALLGATGAALLTGIRLNAATATAGQACVVLPQQTEGPYFVDERLNRSDIRSDPATGRLRSGKPLSLTILVSRLNDGNCEPLSGAQVDLWQCDASGMYSDVEDRQFNTVGQKFLRGHQVTNDRGEANFVTIYPGWYPGRTVHVHFKIRTQPVRQRSLEFTSQLYFDDAVTDLVHGEAPYAQNGQRRARNQNDRIFRRGGDQLKLAVTKTNQGYAASFAVAMQFA